MGNDARGEPGRGYERDALGLPYTTLGYANGSGYTGRSDSQPEGPKRLPHATRGYGGIKQGRPDLSGVDTSDPDYLQEATVPMAAETHGGEDVAIYASGPGAHLFRGVLEQHVIFHLMVEALGTPTVERQRQGRGRRKSAARSPGR